LFENMQEGLAYCRMILENGQPRDFVYLSVNESFERLTGLKNVVGRKVTELIPGIRESNPELFEVYGRAASTGRPEVMETYLPALNIWFSISVYSPEPGHFVAVFDNITERKETEQALREGEARLRSIIDTAQDAFLLVGAQGELLDTNNAASELSGYSREQLLQMTLHDLEAVESDEEIERTIAEVLAAGHARFERTWKHKDGKLLYIEISTTHMGEDRGGYFFTFVHNITQRKQTEQALREGAERFRAMLEQNISAMFIVEDDVLTYANRRATEILGYSTEELIGRPILDLVVEPDRPNIAAAMRQLLSGELKSAERNFGARRKDGTVADIGAHAILATLQGRKAVLGIAQDIGERRKAQAEIERYIGRLEHAMQSTLTAVSLMVELRDPYTAGHERRVGELAAAIGTEMGLPDDTVKGLRLAGYVHDIGKISVPAEILSKPTRLTPIEFELIRGHSLSGYDILKGVDFPWPLAEVILQHHERLDGSGYPRQLRDGAIILEARIMAVADVVEAMSSHRPYRPGLGMDAALEEIARNGGTFYDPQVVAACLCLFRDKAYALPA
jgi:PAS domain S-box-containing protein